MPSWQIYVKMGADVLSAPIFIKNNYFLDKVYTATDECCERLALEHSVLKEGQVNQFMNDLVVLGILGVNSGYGVLSLRYLAVYILHLILLSLGHILVFLAFTCLTQLRLTVPELLELVILGSLDRKSVG